MSWKVARTTLNAVLLSSLMMSVVSTIADAGANAKSGFFRWALAATSAGAPGGLGAPCLNFDFVIGGNAPANALCISDPAGADFARAMGRADRRTATVATFTRGSARAGGGLTTMTAEPSTADSFDLGHSNTGLNQTQFTLAGQMSLDPSSTSNVGGVRAVEILRVAVYGDSASAAAGTGALAKGELRCSATQVSPAQASASGVFSMSDFILTPGPGNTLTVATVPGLTKTVNGVPDTAKVIVEVSVEAASISVPGLSPVGLILLTLLLAAAGFYVLQTRRRAAAV